MSRRVVGPFNRVEGDLEVTLDIVDGRVAEARVNSPLYRGFEGMLLGKDPRDALVLVPRICGICSVSQSAAAAAALRGLAGATGQVPPNGALAADLTLAAENLADHFTHFYLFFMPDFARDAYAGQPWHDAARARFKALEGSASAPALAARADFLRLMGILAGKWPHTLSLQPGGSARAISAAEKIRLHALLRGFRAWLERHFFGDALEAVAALNTVDELADWWARGEGDLRAFLRLAESLDLFALGRGPGRYLSHGAHAAPGQAPLFAPGVWSRDGGPAAFDPAHITEDGRHAWLVDEAPRHPWQGHTRVDADKPDAYSWCKAPRLAGQVAECGALARQLVDGQPLLRELAARGMDGVAARVLARAIEFARLLPAMEDWARALRPGDAFHTPLDLPDEGHAYGLVEAARGALGHWLVVRQGRIANYQIIAPTTWNFSPRDTSGQPGALEQALAGVRTDGPAAGDTPLVVQHVVRSFDPCMVCTVH